MKLKILIVQNNAIINNQAATFEKAETLVSKFSGCKPDIIIFPEVWSCGWCCRNFPSVSEDVNDSSTISFLKNIAIENKALVIGGSFIRKDAGFLKNTCPVISSKGEIIALYDKMHLFSHKGCEENRYITCGDELKLLDFHGTKIGISICYDIRFPELYRAYSKKGAEVLINVAAWSNKKLEHWNIMHRARAIENQCFMLVADQTGLIENSEFNLGHSMVINPWGDIAASLQAEEDCLFYEIDTKEVNDLRKNFPLISDRRDDNIEYFKCKEIKIND